jgi:GT2 family glycosyltransferase
MNSANSGDVERKPLPTISVILVNYNGLVWLPTCLGSLSEQTYRDFEVIVVDNNSSDESVGFIRANYPNVCIIENETNVGFAGGNNIGVEHARGAYIVLLNTDTRSTPTFLADLLQAFADIPKLGCVQPKLLFMHEPEKIDSCGSYFSMTGFLKHIGNQQEESLPEYARPFPIFSVKGACMMFPKAILEAVGGLFDDDFWCYVEESDFCSRVWLAGYSCWYYPTSRVEHAMGGTTGRFVRDHVAIYHSSKNRLLAHLKNLSVRTLARVLPVYFTIHILMIAAYLVTFQFRTASMLIKSLWYNVWHLKETLRKRRVVQTQCRRMSDQEYLPAITGGVGLAETRRFLTYVITYRFRKRRPCV